jgi:uncharacterized protein DUF5691
VTDDGAAIDGYIVTDGGRTVSFEDLVTAATVGVSRKPLAITGLDGPAAGQAGALDAGDQAAALLDAAALMTVAGRAGFQPEQGQRIVGPSPSPEDAAPELPPRAERALRQLGGAQLAPGFAAGDKELLADLLAAASDAGYVASAPLLPDLLDAAVRTVALRPAVTAVLGVRGRWLAAYRADWQRVVEAASTETTSTAAAAAGVTPTGAAPAGPAPTAAGGRTPTDATTAKAASAGTPASADPQTWRTGSRAERHAYLAAERERDPEAGRELLAADWARLPADERAALLAVLARGLSAGDEEFLDGVLDDRAAGVRAIAQRLLTRLPRSRFRQRAADRATAVLGLERHRQRQSLAVTRPANPDAAAARDGIDGRPPSPAIGVGAWLLTQLIAAVPLAAWTDLFGFSPGEIVALPVEPHPDAPRRLDVHAGWRLAAVNQGSAEWAEALLAAGDPDDGGGRPPAAWPDDQRLAAVLPAVRRAERAAALLGGTRLTPGPAAANRVIAEVGGVPMPWPGELADGVVAVLGRAASLAVLPRLPRGLLDLAARGLPATGGRDYAAELTRLADGRPQSWTPLVRKTAETILLRRAFLEEIR